MMINYHIEYPWFRPVVEGDEIQQGEIVESCPIFLPPPDLDIQKQLDSYTLKYEERDVIVMTQSCDLVKELGKIKEVMLCGLWFYSEFGETGLGKDKLEEIRKGRKPEYHILNKCEINGFKKEFRVIDFRKIYSLPIDYFREIVKTKSPRLRLLPPYREHLAQSFARYFMRVGLPVDIPPFK